MLATPRRETLKPSSLLALLNWELAAYDACEGCHFTSIRPMAVPDDRGCNWLDARVQADHRMGASEHFIVRQVVEETRRAYDLAA